MEHYYKFDNENLAMNGFQMLSEQYTLNDSIDNILQKGNYVKVVFKSDYFDDMSLSDLVYKLNNLNEVINVE